MAKTVGDFRSECLKDGEVVCSTIVLHDNWLVTKDLARIWWGLTDSERNTVAGVIIRSYIHVAAVKARGGSANCLGAAGEYRQAVCLHNSIIKFLRLGDGYLFYDSISDCYYTDSFGSEHCYYEEDFGLPVFLTSVVGDKRGFGHSICAFQIGSDQKKFDSWRFFQYGSDDIKPGNWQMPCGWDGSWVRITINDAAPYARFMVCGGYGHKTIAEWKLYPDCKLKVTVSVASSPSGAQLYIDDALIGTT